MKTIDLTPEVLRVLALGIRDLYKGDRNDLAQADEVENLLAKAGYLARRGACYPAENATEGYVRGELTNQLPSGDWTHGAHRGDVLTFDPEGTIPIRTL